MEVKGQQPGRGPDLQTAAAAVGLQLTLNINQTSFRSYGNKHRASHLAAPDGRSSICIFTLMINLT